MSSAEELAQLRAALFAADAPTRAFLAPLLPLRAVQQVLLSFLRDRSRAFADWVWDPRVRQLLEQLRAQNPQAHDHGQDVDRWFARAAQDQWAAQQAAADPRRALADADAAQADGRHKFQQRAFYAAANAFRKSLAHLAAYNAGGGESESERDDGSDGDGDGDGARAWEPEMQARYATLCTNVAICGLKMGDLSLVREFARKALAVDAASSKALYASAKLHLLEHRHDDARAVADRALALHPGNQLLAQFRDEIERAREKEAAAQALVAALAQVKLEEAAAEQLRLAEQQAARVSASDFVPLPPLYDDAHAAAHMNTYFMRVKQRLQVDIVQLHNPDNSEPPLFECAMSNGATGVVLAAGVRGSSKKAVKNDAAKVVIRTLWELKTAASTLLEEDKAYLAQHATMAAAVRDGDEPPAAAAARMPETTATTEPEDEQDPETRAGVKISAYERGLDKVMLLNQLSQQKRLRVEFEVEDRLPDSKVATEFRCAVRINGEVLGAASAPNKKKARADAAQAAFAAALAQQLVFFWEPPADDDDDDGGDAAPR